jgi:hypothetical protein
MHLFRFQQRSLHWRCCLVVAALSLCAPGCTQWTQRWNSLRDTVRGKGYTDDSAQWTKNVRTPSDSTPMAGVDERAREIERNLGVH